MNTDIDRLYVLLMDIKRELRELREALPKPALVNIPKDDTLTPTDPMAPAAGAGGFFGPHVERQNWR